MGLEDGAGNGGNCRMSGPGGTACTVSPGLVYGEGHLEETSCLTEFWFDQAKASVLPAVDHIDFIGLSVAEYEEVMP